MSQPFPNDNIAKLLQRVRLSAEKSQKAHRTPILLAVSKTRPAADIRAAHACGLNQFGESYLQEALDKIDQLADLPITWHFIGPIQSNKTRPIAEHFQWVHSVAREKIARRLSEQRPTGLPPLQVCLQVNISGEESKSGASVEALPALAALVDELPGLQLRGLMAIPAATDDEQEQRQAFARLRRVFEALQQDHPHMDTLSMGMSGDWEAAIAEGSTMIRIGTAIFGPRQR
ncbi:YggS family pyridoxal phosphate-dependent enzyme [Seongchinamella unica]|uniref:Pyridoxal phosphate homeostasis protein n=1 Tax=Seongchinamella unica TaxID=2547392 RepID=A0A4R5LW42_9GAMM|nr:YggS family pyridoxal phosphate-dependent enzyme [Seongchinamella unica]TDG15679.1 YggS family pyridoxal phosphate-dependent enzyme [Seongchinamella unica]